MKLLRLIWKEAAGMFVDGGSLALMTVALIAIVTVLVAGLNLSPALAEALLPRGLGLIRIASVYRAAGKRSGNVPMPAFQPPSDRPAGKGPGRAAAQPASTSVGQSTPR